MRNMSFDYTTQQIQDRSKTVTRRLGWLRLKPGDRIAACKKCMGLKKGEKVERLAELRIVSVRREPLCYILDQGFAECAREGFPHMEPEQFVGFFCRYHRGCEPSTEITRIEFEYCDPEVS